jgi:Rps23 Pro-64 3,4-dihydroxylase Tpa1-like proline 4-hydroxylase
VEEITQCGKLNNRVDIAANVYSQGCHLGCHDDCISTRRISYILYLSDADWMAKDGGAIELYSQSNNIPETLVLPHFSTLMLFEVRGTNTFD